FAISKTKAGDPLESPASGIQNCIGFYFVFSNCCLINNSARSGTTSHAISRTTLSDIISTTRRAMTSIISGVNVPALIGADGSAATTGSGSAKIGSGSTTATSLISDANGTSCVSANDE